jgi:hypothetical protein
MKHVTWLIIWLLWLTGIVAAKGFWWTVLSLIPLVGAYFGLEFYLKAAGLL